MLDVININARCCFFFRYSMTAVYKNLGHSRHLSKRNKSLFITTTTTDISESQRTVK